MSTGSRSRREFLLNSAAGLSAAWVTANYAGILEAAAYAQQGPAGGQSASFAFFRPEQAAEVEAMAAQIIPTDDTPGAREARVINFIDRTLTTFEKDRQNDYTQGLRELETQTKQLFPSATKFSALTSPQQIQVLTAMEKTKFFDLVRTHTITGFFASPAHGGNYNKIGWKLVNYDDSMKFQPPFGYYDALPQFRR
jgi:gluconate 2-dehydrogenase gamma chain